MYKVLFVCTGNICRSPTAEIVLRHKAQNAGLTPNLVVASAATHGDNKGEKPHWRSVRVAEKKGYKFPGDQLSRQFLPQDHEEFDLILGMTKCHVELLQPGWFDKPKGEVALFLEYAGLGRKEVPDPYGKNWADFEKTLALIESGVDKLLLKLSPKIH